MSNIVTQMERAIVQRVRDEDIDDTDFVDMLDIWEIIQIEGMGYCYKGRIKNQLNKWWEGKLS